MQTLKEVAKETSKEEPPKVLLSIKEQTRQIGINAVWCHHGWMETDISKHKKLLTMQSSL